MEGGLLEVRDGRKPYAARGAVLMDLNGSGDHQLADRRAALTSGDGIMLGSVGDRGLIDLDDSSQGAALGSHHLSVGHPWAKSHIWMDLSQGDKP